MKRQKSAVPSLPTYRVNTVGLGALRPMNGLRSDYAACARMLPSYQPANPPYAIFFTSINCARSKWIENRPSCLALHLYAYRDTSVLIRIRTLCLPYAREKRVDKVAVGLRRYKGSCDEKPRVEKCLARPPRTLCAIRVLVSDFTETSHCYVFLSTGPHACQGSLFPP